MIKVLGLIILMTISGYAFAHDEEKHKWPLGKLVDDDEAFWAHGDNHFKLRCAGQEEICRQEARLLCEDKEASLASYKNSIYFIKHHHQEERHVYTGFYVVDVYCRALSPELSRGRPEMHDNEVILTAACGKDANGEWYSALEAINETPIIE